MGLSVNIVKPVKPDETVVSYISLVSEISKIGRRAGADLETIEMKDQKMVESVQRGIRSRFFRSG